MVHDTALQPCLQRPGLSQHFLSSLPEGGDPYLGVRFGYDLGTLFSVLGYDLDRTGVRFYLYLGTFFPYLDRTWVRLGSYLVAVWVVLGGQRAE